MFFSAAGRELFPIHLTADWALIPKFPISLETTITWFCFLLWRKKLLVSALQAVTLPLIVLKSSKLYSFILKYTPPLSPGINSYTCSWAIAYPDIWLWQGREKGWMYAPSSHAGCGWGSRVIRNLSVASGSGAMHVTFAKLGILMAQTQHGNSGDGCCQSSSPCSSCIPSCCSPTGLAPIVSCLVPPCCPFLPALHSVSLSCYAVRWGT